MSNESNSAAGPRLSIEPPEIVPSSSGSSGSSGAQAPPAKRAKWEVNATAAPSPGATRSSACRVASGRADAPETRATTTTTTATAGATAVGTAPGREAPSMLGENASVQVAPAPAMAPALAPAQQQQDPVNPKSVEDIELEVRELLDLELLGNDKAVKMNALSTLFGYFTEAATNGGPVEFQEHRRAFSDWNGFHLVLIALQQEINANEGPNHGVVFYAVHFVQLWYFQSQRRSGPISFKGIELITRGMQAFPNDESIQRMAVIGIFNFTVDNDAGRRLKVLEAGVIPHIVHAMTKFPADGRIQYSAIWVLKRLCQIGNQRHVERLIDDGALTAAADAYTKHRACVGPQCSTVRGDPQCKVREAARSLMNELHE